MNVEPTKPCLTEVRSKQFPGGVTSLAMINKRLVLIGTDDGSIYQLDILTFDSAMLSTCHTGAILDIAFPKGVDTGQVFSKGIKISPPNSHQKILGTNGLRMGALLGFISDIHMVL